MQLLNNKGFTLLEIIIVLAILGAIATVVLPGMHVNFDSQMSASLRNFTGQIRAAYDNAVFTGRLQRMVVNVKTGEYWVEQAPTNFRGRPPLVDDDKNALNESAKKSFTDNLDEQIKNQSNRQSPYSTDDNPVYYSLRSIPLVQKNVFAQVNWNEVDDAIIKKQSLLGSVVFAKFVSEFGSRDLEFPILANSSDDKPAFGYIYFLPDATTTPASIYLAIKRKDNTISDNDVKYTLNLNTLTGQSTILEGFQDANFSIPKK